MYSCHNQPEHNRPTKTITLRTCQCRTIFGFFALSTLKPIHHSMFSSIGTDPTSAIEWRTRSHAFRSTSIATGCHLRANMLWVKGFLDIFWKHTILFMEEIRLTTCFHLLSYMKAYEKWDTWDTVFSNINWLAGFLPWTVSSGESRTSSQHLSHLGVHRNGN